MSSSSSRRSFLTTIGTGAVCAAAAGLTAATTGTRSKSSMPQKQNAQPSFRFVFMPCIHYRPEHSSAEGFTKAVEAVNALNPKPDLILTGGDLIQNLRDRSLEESEKLFDEFLKIMKKADVPSVHHCIGNHDLAGWNKPDEFQNDSKYGKGLFQQKLDLPKTYYSFDHSGWHFVVLDYLKVVKPGEFSPELDDEQLDWLASDIKAANGKPTLIISHAPPVSAVELFTERAKRDDQQWTVPYGRVLKNTPEILKAVEGGEVKAFLSGHLHMVEDLELLGHRFICSGSVSGQQWTGPREGKTQEGFGIFDCEADGGLAFEYSDYGWDNKPE